MEFDFTNAIEILVGAFLATASNTQFREKVWERYYLLQNFKTTQSKTLLFISELVLSFY